MKIMATRRQAVACLVALALAPLQAVSTAVKGQALAQRSFRTSSKGVVVPLRFKQQLLVCNAYPSDSPVVIRRNARESMVNAEHALGFKECRYMNNQVQKRDRIHFSLRDVEVEGTFEVGDLPSTDALLLLVLEKRPATPKVSFQSFAFPSGADAKDAQLAVINTFTGNASSPHLKMQDHIAEKEKQTITKRTEKLNFNRVYSVEAGGYDVSITDEHRAGLSDTALEAFTRKSLNLARNSNYVIIRTGGDNFKESLVVFPECPSPSGSIRFETFFATLVGFLVATFHIF